MKKFIPLYLLLIAFISCKNEPKQYKNALERALELSEKNRTELEKVLTHYSKNDNDSLKYKAAIFLIENMERHSYHLIKSRKEWDNILKLSDSLIITKYKDYEAIMDSVFKSSKIRYNFQKDIQQVKAEDLIGNIDAAFSVWPKPWNSYIGFEDFCNYILPYRQKSEPLDFSLRKEYYQKNLQKLNDSTSIENMIEFVNELSSIPYGFRYKRLIPFDQSINDIEKGKMMDCVDASIYSVFKGRSIGIPMAIDFTVWPNFRSSHYWSSLVFSKDSTLYADKNYFWGKSGSYRLRRKIAKIYRIMYESQESFGTPREDNKAWTFLDNFNIMDVTSQYIETTNIKMKLKTINGKSFSTGYLCVFNDKKWKPVAKSVIKQKGILFENIGRGNTYLIACFKNKMLIPVSDIFSINEKGVVQYHKANQSQKRKVKLTRKTKKTKVKHFAKAMFETEFQLANTPNFKNPKTIYQIKHGDSVFIPRTIDINITKEYRYARYKSAFNKVARIAEMQWFSGKNKIKGDPIGDENTDYERHGHNAFDGDLLSYFSTGIAKEGNAWIGLDFGERRHITKLFFAPRSDVNYVKPNDIYELFYWDDEWVSLGKKTAQDYFVEYNGVPKNAVLWLRNLSGGIEEELFIYKDGKQCFWNSSEY